jgi:fatty acid desaturase
MSDRPHWKRHAGQLALPSLGLAALTLGGHAAVWWAVLGGHLGLAAGLGLQTLFAYFAFTVAHEAAHGNLVGRHAGLRRLEVGLGWASGALLFAPWSAFKVLHLEHHSHTNDPERDPDFWVAGHTPLGVVARCFTIVPHYYRDFLLGPTSRTNAGRAARTSTLAGLAGLGALALGLALGGLGVELVALWLAPAFLASGVLAFAFDWLPHAPHDRRGRYRDTRLVTLPGLGVLLLGQNLHLIHHLYPRVPFYAYAACARTLAAELAEQEVEVIGPAPRPWPEAPPARA